MNRRQFFAVFGLSLAALACTHTLPATAEARNRDGTGPDGRGPRSGRDCDGSGPGPRGGRDCDGSGPGPRSGRGQGRGQGRGNGNTFRPRNNGSGGYGPRDGSGPGYGPRDGSGPRHVAP